MNDPQYDCPHDLRDIAAQDGSVILKRCVRCDTQLIPAKAVSVRLGPGRHILQNHTQSHGRPGRGRNRPARPWLFGAHPLSYIKTKDNPTRGLSLADIVEQNEEHERIRPSQQRIGFHETTEHAPQSWANDRRRAAEFVDCRREYWKTYLQSDENEPLTVFISEN